MPSSRHRSTLARIAIVTAALGLAGAASLARADEPGTGGLRVSGFGTVGLENTSSAQGWGLRRDINQPYFGSGTRGDVDSRLGVQLNYAATEQVELVTQVVAERRSAYRPASDSLEWAYLAWRPDADTVARFGRVDTEFFLMSDYRNVGFAYRYVRPPVEFYGSMPTWIDGAEIERQWIVGDDLWRAKMFAGRGYGGDLSSDSGSPLNPIVGALVSHEADGLLLRGALTYVHLGRAGDTLQPLLQGLNGVAALPIPGLAAQAHDLLSRVNYADSHLVYAGLAASYELNDWQWSAEATRVSGTQAIAFDAWYAGLGHRFGKLLWFGGFSGIRSPGGLIDAPDWYSSTAPVLGPAAAQQLQALAEGASYAANITHAHQQTTTVGLRCDLSSKLALKFQLDETRVGAYGSRLWSHPTAGGGRARVVSTTLDFVF
jgi:hypothetical protein